MLAALVRTAGTLLVTVLILSPAAVWAQEEEIEEVPPPLDIAETAGEWWAKFQKPEFIAGVIGALANILVVIVIAAAVYLAVMLAFARAVRRVERDSADAAPPERRRKQRVITALELVRSIVRWVILITAFVWVLGSAGMDIRPVLAGAGVLGLAVGFGSQNLVRDIVSGFFMLLEGQYAVGDYVRVGAAFGMVESVGIRVTVLRDLDNQRHFIPNGVIAQVTVFDEPFVNHIVEVPLDSPDDCESAVVALREMIRRMKREYERYLVYYTQPHAVMCNGASIVRLPVAIFPTQDWLVNEEIPAAVRDTLAQAEIPLREGRDVRVFMDLSRMPEYHHADEDDEEQEANCA